MPNISVILPAYNEADRIGDTLKALTDIPQLLEAEIIVVDDGSHDNTAHIASKWTDHIVKLNKNRGKGYALNTGWKQCHGEIVVFLDSDLGQSAQYVSALIDPVLAGACDMSIARFPTPVKKAGFGLVKRMAQTGVERLTGHRLEATLSGQRAIRRELLENVPLLSTDFGIEIGLTVESLRRGYRLLEVPINFQHRETGRDWYGFMHRGRQFIDVSKALYRLWRNAT